MHTVATIAYDAVNPFELAVATEVFGFERPELGVPWYRFLICAVEPRPIRTSVDLLLSTPYSLQHAARADTVIVPSFRPGVVPVPDTLHIFSLSGLPNRSGEWPYGGPAALSCQPAASIGAASLASSGRLAVTRTRIESAPRANCYEFGVALCWPSGGPALSCD